MAKFGNQWRVQSPWALAICLLIALDLHFDALLLTEAASDFFESHETTTAELGDAEVEVTWESMPDPLDAVTDSQTPDAVEPPDMNEPPEAQERPEEPKPEPVVVPKEEEPAPKPEVVEQPRASLQSIEQKSDDPDVAAPENPRFVAQENRRVQEETVAKVRSYAQDDPQPSVSGAGVEEPDGNANETEVADAEDREGAEASAEAQEKEVAVQEVRQPSEGAAQPASEQAPRTTGQVLALEGGEPMALPESSSANKRASGPDQRLQLSWSGFRGAVGEKTLEEERHAYLLRKQSRIRGSNREKTFREFRAAIENFVPNVKSGEQTALNAAASPFASYIAAIHRQIHREFAEDFLPGLPAGSMSPFSDESLMTKLEIILNADGTIHKIGVVRTSGLMPFDYGAYAAVTRAAPFPTAPNAIRSGDGRVYLHWGFYRSQRQCGTFNAEPYILPNVGGTKKPSGPIDAPPLAPGSKHTSTMPRGRQGGHAYAIR